jgi:hypothetical protein
MNTEWGLDFNPNSFREAAQKGRNGKSANSRPLAVPGKLCLRDCNVDEGD